MLKQQMAECRESELTTDQYGSDGSHAAANVDISEWTNSQDLKSQGKRSHIIHAILYNCKITGNQNMDHLSTILNTGWDVNEILSISEYHWKEVHKTALCIAAGQGCTEAVKMLLDAGAKCKTSGVLQNPLVEALRKSSTDVLKLLLNHGADPNDHDDQFENIPLLNAIANCKHYHKQNVMESVQLLLEHGADQNVIGTCGYKGKCVQRSALHEAVYQGWTDGAKMLLDVGAKSKMLGVLANPLILALQRTDCPPELIKLLLEHGADPNDHDGQFEDIPLLVCAVFSGRSDQNVTDIVQLLLEHGADPNVTAEYNHNKYCALYGALDATIDLCASLFKTLVRFGADVNHEMDGEKPLLHRMMGRNIPGFDISLDLFFLHGGNISMEDCYHTTALEYAVRDDAHSTNIRWLIRHGAHTSPMHMTLFKEHFIGEFIPLRYPETPLILLQAGMRVSHGAHKQLNNMEMAISTWLQEDTSEDEDIFRTTPAWLRDYTEVSNIHVTIKGILEQFDEDEEEELQRMRCNLQKCTFPEYWTQQMVDLEEFSSESLNVYPVDPVDDYANYQHIQEEWQNILNQIHRVLEFLSQTQSLQWYCRRCVRENLVSLQPSIVKTLPIPAKLKRYILCHEI